jgi:hypothetical protein
MQTIDMTPTWTGIVGLMILVLQNEDASPQSHKGARDELYRMAGLADLYVAEHKQTEQEAA